MKIRIIFSETATGSDPERIDTEVEQVNEESILEVFGDAHFDNLTRNRNDITLVKARGGPPKWAFIIHWHDSYFGNQLITGHVYTEFV